MANIGNTYLGNGDLSKFAQYFTQAYGYVIQTNNILNSSSKGDHELLAINYAYNNSNLIKNSKFLFKITGRYYVPELEGLLNWSLEGLQRLLKEKVKLNDSFIELGDRIIFDNGLSIIIYAKNWF